MSSEMIVEDLELSVRTFNCLKARGINTVEDIIDLLEKGGLEGLLKLRNMNSKCAYEILDVLKKRQIYTNKELNKIIESYRKQRPIFKSYDELNTINIDEFDFCGYTYDSLVEQKIRTLDDLNGKAMSDLKLSQRSAEDFILKLGLEGIRFRKSFHKAETVKAVILGIAIADALGVPVEFMDREKLAYKPVKDYVGYGTHDVPAGTWSDDTSMVLATLDSLARGLDYTDIMGRFCEWKQNAAYTATDEVFDMGVTTNDALCKFMKGTPALECGGPLVSDNGNGSLMRIAPAVLYVNSMFADTSIEERIEIVHNISALTHSHLRSKIGCGIYAFVLMELLKASDKESVTYGLKRAKWHYEEQLEYSEELSFFSRLFEESFGELPVEVIKSSGYVVDTLEAAIWCVLNTDSYSDCVLKAVNLGKDTDTVAAVAGSLAAVLYGLEGIPKKWIDELKNKELLLEICDRFVEWQNSMPSLQKDASRGNLHEEALGKLKERNRNEHIQYFAEAMLSKYRDRNADDRSVSPEFFIYTCFAFGFTIDLQELGNSYRETFGKDEFTKVDAKAFSRIAFKIKDVDMLGSVIFAKWRWITHWSSQSLVSEENKAWFIVAFERLRELASYPPIERKSFNYLVDIHGHYLPGIDDGASNVEMSIAMIKSAYKQGVRDIICTAHSWGYISKYSNAFEQLQERLKEEALNIGFYKGCEVACDERSLSVIIDRIEAGELQTIAGSKYLLLEFKQNVEGIEVLRCVKQLMELTDCIPVIAHIERYYNLYEDEHSLDILKNWSIPIQINAYSLMEEKNENIKSFARKLLKEQVVTFIGSDAHRTTHRPVKVQAGVEYIYANCDEEYAKDICFRNAERMLFSK